MSDLKYTDILLLGKTGMGKSSTGNNLLGLKSKGISDGLDGVATRLKVWPFSGEEGISDHPYQGSNKVNQLKRLGRQSLLGRHVPVDDSFTWSESKAAKRKRNSENQKNDSRPPKSGSCMAVQDESDFIAEADEIDSHWSYTNGIEAFSTMSASKHNGESLAAEQRPSNSEQLQSNPGSAKTTQELKYFTVGKGALSETTQLKLISSEISQNRVLDTPGFATSGSLLPVIQANLELIHNIAQLQKVHSLKFRYVLYFLPCRGPPQRADRALKDEIAIVHHYFGESIWRRLVFVLTAPPEFQEPAMFSLLTDGPLKKKAEDVISVAMQDVWKSYGVASLNFEAPHVIFIAQEESFDCIMRKIEHAFPKDDVGGLELRSDICINCSAHVRIKVDPEAKVASDKHVPTWATDEISGSSVSTCHPRFEKTLMAEFIGFLTRNETTETCIKCHERRGVSTGCTVVGTMYANIKVSHKTMQPMETIWR